MKTIFFTCEHGGNDIPIGYTSLFEGNEEVLKSHKGWDIGALKVASSLSKQLEAPLVFSTTSRLLVELNRSLHHAHLFSQYTKELSEKDKKNILTQYYFPYRNTVIENLKNEVAKGAVLHISVHSFTPELNGKVRNTDIGLLYDPMATMEKSFCATWKKEIKKESDLRIRYNYPYRGTADGFTTFLRKLFPQQYSGIELEINQKLLQTPFTMAKVMAVIGQSLSNAISQFQES